MVDLLDSIDGALDGIDGVVLDQWGVLHNGTEPYAGASGALCRLRDRGLRLAVLSNSGKRAEPNARRMARLGFPAEWFDCVMTSGEALWRDFAEGRMEFSTLHPIERTPGDAENWRSGLPVRFAPLDEAEAVLLMGLPDFATADSYRETLDVAMRRGLPLLCSNPDRASPRKGGRLAISPGALAHAYASSGGETVFYGKPYPAVFRALESALELPPERLLLAGDSLEHDVAGARNAGWKSVFVRGGLHAADFGEGSIESTLQDLARRVAAPLPDATLEALR